MKQRFKFNVYKIYYESGKEYKKFIGSTVAASDRQAINNIRFRTGNDYYNAYAGRSMEYRWTAERRYE